MSDPENTRALNAMTRAGLTLSESLDPAKEHAFLAAPDISRKRLSRLREMARGQGLTAPRGGAGRGQGRKAADGATGTVPVLVRVTPAQKAKLATLGGSVWMRKAIDEA
jgi:hypothetical protein